MKNIHVIPTDKSGRIGRFVDTQEFILRSGKDIPRGENVNIYITSDEEIKEGDWIISDALSVYPKHIVKVFKKDRILWVNVDGNILDVFEDRDRKIILTTDQDLIKDGVQAIDNEFLEWFLNNPNREEVEVKIKTKWKTTVYDQPDMEDVGYTYKINIPQEECCESANGFYLGTTCPKCNQPFRSVIEKPKQETIEEVAERMLPDFKLTQDVFDFVFKINTPTSEPKQETIENAAEDFANSKKWMDGGASEWVQHIFKEGAKWNQERSYSEEEVDVLIHELINKFTDWSGSYVYNDKLIEIYKQFKKK